MEDDDDIIKEKLTCMKRIECTDDTDRAFPDTMREGVYDAWETARSDIHAQWQEKTDPLNVQPSIPKLFREVGQHLRDNWPADLTQDKLYETVESVEAKWPRRIEREVRNVYEDESLTPMEKTRQIVDKVESFGLTPQDIPDPNPQSTRTR